MNGLVQCQSAADRITFILNVLLGVLVHWRRVFKFDEVALKLTLVSSLHLAEWGFSKSETGAHVAHAAHAGDKSDKLRKCYTWKYNWDAAVMNVEVKWHCRTHESSYVDVLSMEVDGYEDDFVRRTAGMWA